MRTKYKQLLTVGIGLLFAPTLGVLLVAGSLTYGGLLGSALIIMIPAVLYLAGLYSILHGFDRRGDETAISGSLH